MIPFRVKKLTKTAKAPHRNCESDLWDLYADKFEYVVLGNIFKCDYRKDLLDFDKRWYKFTENHDMIVSESKKAFLANRTSFELLPSARILVKTGISLELPKYCKYLYTNEQRPEDALMVDGWSFTNTGRLYDGDDLHDDIKPVARTHGFPLTLESKLIKKYAVADIRPRSGLALKHGITVLNTPGTIDNSYRKEIGVILYNAGHEPYKITKGDKIAQMLIRPLYPSKMEIVEHIEDTGRGGYGSTGK